MNKQQFIEASLSRIWRDYQEIEFGIITAGRIGEQDTDAVFSAITSHLKRAGYKFVPIDAFGQEEIDGNLEQKNQPFLLVKNVKADGRPLVDSGAFEVFMLDIAKKNKQRAVVLQNPKSGTKFYPLGNDVGELVPPKLYARTLKFSPEKTVQFFSTILGDSFTLEGFKYGIKIQNWIHGMALEIRGETDFFRRVSIETWRKMIMESNK